MRDSCTWVIGGPKTFRLGSRQILSKKQEIDFKTKTIGWGGNLQNIEKEMRKIYIPDEGKILVQTDQGGAEALIMSYDCVSGNYRQLFINNVKPHVYVAIHLFHDIWKRKMSEYNLAGTIDFDINTIINTPIDKLKLLPHWKNLDLLIKDSDNWPVNERYYYFAKQTCHSANYGIAADKFRMNVLEKSGGKIVLEREEAARFLHVYRSLFPEIPERNNRIRQIADEHRILFNFFGHPYHISQYAPTESNYQEFYAWGPQSTVGMITNIAIANMQSFIEKEKLDWDVLLNGHDSIVSQCPIAEVLDCAKMQKLFIEQEFISPIDGVVFKMKSETQAGFNWSPCKTVLKDGVETIVNPEGLKEIKI